MRKNQAMETDNPGLNHSSIKICSNIIILFMTSFFYFYSIY